MAEDWEDNDYDAYDLAIYTLAAFCIGMLVGIGLMAVTLR